MANKICVGGYTEFKGVYVGSTPVKEIWIGDTKVYPVYAVKITKVVLIGYHDGDITPDGDLRAGGGSTEKCRVYYTIDGANETYEDKTFSRVTAYSLGETSTTSRKQITTSQISVTITYKGNSDTYKFHVYQEINKFIGMSWEGEASGGSIFVPSFERGGGTKSTDNLKDAAKNTLKVKADYTSGSYDQTPTIKMSYSWKSSSYSFSVSGTSSTTSITVGSTSYTRSATITRIATFKSGTYVCPTTAECSGVCNQLYSVNEEFVDLGLPSGTLWAKKNLGATKESEYGYFYFWGALLPYDQKVSSSEESKKKPYLGTSDLDDAHDAAYQSTGGRCRIPTLTQVYELCNTSYTRMVQNVTVDGVKCIRVESKSDSSKYIIFPCAGYGNNKTGQWKMYGVGKVVESITRTWTADYSGQKRFKSLYLSVSPIDSLTDNSMFTESEVVPIRAVKSK